MKSCTAGLGTSRAAWLRCRESSWAGCLITQSGCFVIKSLFGFTISGSNHSPKAIGSFLPASMRGTSPLVNFMGSTVQSPRPALSPVRAFWPTPNQPSSSTYSSMPSSWLCFIISVIAISFTRKPHPSQLLLSTGRIRSPPAIPYCRAYR